MANKVAAPVRVKNKLEMMADPNVSYLNSGQDSWLAGKRKHTYALNRAADNLRAPGLQVTPEITAKRAGADAMGTGALELPGPLQAGGWGW